MKLSNVLYTTHLGDLGHLEILSQLTRSHAASLPSASCDCLMFTTSHILTKSKIGRKSYESLMFTTLHFDKIHIFSENLQSQAPDIF